MPSTHIAVWFHKSSPTRRHAAPSVAYGAGIGSRTYVLDTSVLLSDPRALTSFAEHHVVIPLVVLTELEEKRHHPELGWAARTALRILEEFRTQHGTLTEPMVANDEGGTLRVEVNHADVDGLAPALRTGVNDHRILAVARNLANEGHDVVLVSKDLPLRLKAGIVGLAADEYRRELATDDDWTGYRELVVPGSVIDELYANREIDLEAARELPCHTGLALVAGSQSALTRVTPDKRVRRVDPDRSVFDVTGRSAEQRIALDLLLDDSIGIVSLGGRAGTGKSVLALAAGLDAVIERRTHKRVVVFRPLYSVGGQELGYLPGTEAEKMLPWAAAVTDALDAISTPALTSEILQRGWLEILPLTHIRGRSITDSFVIIDEAQNLERSVLLTALSRLGQSSRVVLTHDVAQRDNLRVGRRDGVVSVIDALRGHPLFAHITLTRSERSPVAALVTSLLDGETT
ncbi:MAG TPA: PhoH family protein [Acidimicrobiales bacterium]